MRTCGAFGMLMNMPTVIEFLRTQFSDAYQSIRARVQGLGDDEFFWEPLPGCWSVRKGAGGRWAADYPEPPHPEPPPLTTIAWRLVHVAECKLMYHEYAFGPARLTWPEIDSAHTAADAIAALDRGQTLLAADLTAMTDRDLTRLVMTNWGEEWPAWRIFDTMISHDLLHGGEIGVLRDIYRLRGTDLAGSMPPRNAKGRSRDELRQEVGDELAADFDQSSLPRLST